MVATHDRGLIEAHPARTLFLDRGSVVKDGWVTGTVNRHAWREVKRQLRESGAGRPGGRRAGDGCERVGRRPVERPRAGSTVELLARDRHATVVAVARGPGRGGEP